MSVMVRCQVCGEQTELRRAVSGKSLNLCHKTKCWVSRWPEDEKEVYRERIGRMLTTKPDKGKEVKFGELMEMAIKGEL